jgi:hypothetical protein
MKRKALIVWGGWDGHEPEQVSGIFAEILKENDFEVKVSNTLDSFRDEDELKSLHLIIPVWTMGEITKEQLFPVLLAVGNGTGIAGCHGGMGDAFRDSVQWQFMVGGQWVAHPGGDGTKYRVNMKKSSSSPIVRGIDDFEVTSEQYYMQYDPAIDILAATRYPVADGFHAANGEVDVPVVWTKLWGRGRVFYNSLGHHADIAAMEPVRTIMERGFLWAAEGKDIALKAGKPDLSTEDLKKAF